MTSMVERDTQVPDMDSLRFGSEMLPDGIKITATVDMVPAKLVERNGTIEAAHLPRA